MLIDLHHHLPLDPPCPYTQTYAEAIEQVADEFGIDYVCISAVGADYRNRSNQECLVLAAKCPRVIPFARIYFDRDTPEAVSRAAGEGFRGLKFIAPHKDYDDPSYMPVYEAAARNRLPCLFHTGFVGPSVNDSRLRVSSGRMRPVFLETIARRYPDLPIIGAHLGGPWVEEAASTMAFNPNVYFDLSGIIGGLPADFFRRPWIHGFEWGKIVFGTDAMIRDFHVPYHGYQRVLSDLDVPQATQNAIFGGNAAKLLGLEQAASLSG